MVNNSIKIDTENVAELVYH